jgi:hypothetical protein
LEVGSIPIYVLFFCCVPRDSAGHIVIVC